MGIYTRVSSLCNRGSRFGAFALIITATLVPAINAHAAIVSSDFEIDADGWLGHACSGAGLCSVEEFDWTSMLTHVQTGGSAPGGGTPIADNKYIDLRDPGADYAARLEPNPVKYDGAFVHGRTVTFDALIRKNGGGGEFDVLPEFGAIVAPLIAIETVEFGTLIYITTDLPEPDGDWKHYSVTLADDPLANGNGWVIVDPFGDIIDPDASLFMAALADQKRTTVIAEWLKEGEELETGGIDNFQVVPLPAALPLLLSALVALGIGARRT